MDPQAQIDHIRSLQGSHEEERALLEGGVDAFTPARGGTNQGYEVRLSTGVDAYFKPLNGINVRIARMYGHDRVSATIAEACAWHLARELGGALEHLVAPCVLRMIPEIDPDAPGALSAIRGEPFEADALQAYVNDYTTNKAVIEPVAFFDSLIAQQDRNVGNVRWDAAASELHIIDHGYSFARPGDTMNASPIVVTRGMAGDPALTAWEIEALEHLLSTSDLCGLAAALGDERAHALERRARMMLSPTILPFGAF
jgi:hypothetical protein